MEERTFLLGSQTKSPDSLSAHAHDISSRLKKGLLDPMYQNCPSLVVKWPKVEVSFEQWSHELQTLRKTYSGSALLQGVQLTL